MTDCYIVVVDGHEIGEIQTAELDSYPQHAREVGIPDAAGVDIFIGEPAWRNRGVGTEVVKSFVRQIAFARPSVKTCIIDPEPDNRRAIRCYEKAGFCYVRTFHSD